jgi:hypothetical protein
MTDNFSISNPFNLSFENSKDEERIVNKKEQREKNKGNSVEYIVNDE